MTMPSPPRGPLASRSRAAGAADVTDVRPKGEGIRETARPGPAAAAAPGGRPGLAFLRAHPAHWVALALGAGLAPKAAGTVGTLWAWAVWAGLVQPWLTPAQQGALIAVALPLGWWASAVTARHLRMADPGAIVWDEVVAFWLVLWLLLPASLAAQCLAFGLFRFFDAVKPGPVGWADRLFHRAGGWRGALGIMLDDLAAAACTLLVLAVAVRAQWLGA